MKYLYVVFLISFGTLSAQTDSLAYSVDLGDVVVTAQYLPTDARNAIHKVTVVNKAEWEEQGVFNLSELLQRQMNVQVAPDPILGDGVSIQGFGGQNIQVMIDGVPVIGRLGGNIDLSQLDMSRFVRVEIIPGALSTRYGSNAAGGVINLISRSRQLNTWSLEGGSQFETINLERHFLRLGRQIGNFRLFGGLSQYDATFASVDSLRNGSLPWNPKDQFSYDVGIDYKLGDSLTMSYTYRNFSEQLTLYGEIRRPQFRPYAIDQFFDTDREDHAAKLLWKPAEKWHINLTAGLNRFNRYKNTLRLDIEEGNTDPEPNGQDTTTYTGNLIRLSTTRTHPDDKLDLQLGLEYVNESGSGKRIFEPEAQTNKPHIRTMASWFGLTWHLNDRLALESTTRLGYNSKYDHPVVPAVNLLWKPTEKWRIRSSFARSFRAPSLQELYFRFIDVNHYIIGNQDLEAETGQNWRLGIDIVDANKGKTAMGAEFFLNQLRNRITLGETEPGVYSYINLEEYETFGVNLNIRHEFSRHLRLELGSALTRLQNNFLAAEQAGAAPDFISQFETQGQLSYQIPGLGWSFQLDHRYIGRRDRYFLSEDGSVDQGFIADYHLMHLTTRKTLWRGKVSVSAGIKNMLDRVRTPIAGGGGGGAHSGGANSRLVDFGRRAFLAVGVQL